MAQRMGVTGAVDPGISSLPLGADGVSPLDMAGAYAAIANDGICNEPVLHRPHRGPRRQRHLRAPAERRSGRCPGRRPAWPPRSSRRQRRGRAPARRATIGDQPAAGKTGTAQDNVDAWFVGYTPHLATAVWMGVPDLSVPMRNVGGIKVIGGTYPARIWQRFTAASLDGQPSVSFPTPERTRSGKYLHMESEPDKPAPAEPVVGEDIGGTPTAPPPSFDFTTTTRRNRPPKDTTTSGTWPPGPGDGDG